MAETGAVTTRGERVQLTTPDGPAEAYLTRPADTTGPHPGVLLYMDAIGLRPQVERVADRIADWGHVVLAPNVFHRHGTAAEIAPTTDLRIPGEREAFFATVMPLVASHSAEEAARDLPAYVAALDADPDVAPGPIGTVGYCMGGRLALRAGAQLPDRVAAIAMFHVGGLVTDAPDSPHLSIPQVRGEVLAGYADHDGSMPPEAVTTVDEALSAAGLAHTTAVYPGASHGFVMADTSMYDEDAAERHYRELQDLFARALA